MKTFHFFIFVLLWEITNGVIDNGILGDPYVNCGADNIEIRFDTRGSFRGIIFVEGQIKNPECRSVPINDQSLSSRNAEIKLNFNNCGLEKRISTHPKGLFISTTLILAFNPEFLSKIDRIYMVQCFYMEMTMNLEKQIQVTMPPPPIQTQQVPMPVCRYEVLDGSPSGQPVYYATVGQQVYHKWTCDTETENQFCMIVHSCTVDDGNGDKVLLIDEKGCAQDKYLLQNLDYVTDLMVGKEAHVYKYADRPSMYFDCQISLSIKEPEQQYCDVPSCPDPPRRRRQNFNISQLWGTNYKPEIKNKLDATQVKYESVIKNKLFIETFINTEQSFCINKMEISSMAILNIIMISGAIWFFRNTSKQNK